MGQVPEASQPAVPRKGTASPDRTAGAAGIVSKHFAVRVQAVTVTSVRTSIPHGLYAAQQGKQRKSYRTTDPIKGRPVQNTY